MAELDYEAQFRATVKALEEMKNAAFKDVDFAEAQLGRAVVDHPTNDHSFQIASVKQKRARADALNEALRTAFGFLTGQLIPKP